MDPLTLAVVVFAVILAVGYFAGGVLNRRRASLWVRALRDGFGGAPSATLSWPARNAFRLELERPLPGVKRLVVQGLLAPRETLLVWAVWTLRRRGDLLDLEAELDALPADVGLIFDPSHRLGRTARQAATAAGYRVSEAGAAGLRVAWRNETGRAFMERLLPLAGQIGDVVVLETKAAQPRLTLVLSLRGAPQAAVVRLSPTMARLVAEAGGNPERQLKRH